MKAPNTCACGRRCMHLRCWRCNKERCIRQTAAATRHRGRGTRQLASAERLTELAYRVEHGLPLFPQRRQDR
jgi:hypothetical protein